MLHNFENKSLQFLSRLIPLCFIDFVIIINWIFLYIPYLIVAEVYKNYSFFSDFGPYHCIQLSH